MSNTSTALRIVPVAPLTLPVATPANDRALPANDNARGPDFVEQWLLHRREELKLVCYERLELLGGVLQWTLEGRIDGRLVVSATCTAAAGDRRLRELVRGWCSARRVPRWSFRPGEQAPKAKAAALEAQAKTPMKRRGVLEVQWAR